MDNNYDDYLVFRESYSSKINKRINDVFSMIEEAFIKYYGYEYKDIILERLDRTVLVYHLPDIIIYCLFKDIPDFIKKNLEKMTKDILGILGIKVSSKEIFDKSYRIELFNFLFGDLHVFNSNISNLGILSFDKEYNDMVSIDKKNKFLKEAFGTVNISIEDKIKIINCIDYIKDNLGEVKNVEDKYYNSKDILEKLTWRLNNGLFKLEVDEDNFLALGDANFVGTNYDFVMKYKTIKDYIYACILRKDNFNPFQFSLPLDDDYLLRFVFLPIFFVNDKDFFHELNHAVRSSIYKDSNGKLSVKSGIVMGEDKTNLKMEELLCDISALEIYNIFRSICNDVIFDDDILVGNKIEESFYEQRYQFVDEFYKNFICDINNICFEDDITNLIEAVGSNNFDSLVNFINFNYDDNVLDCDKLDALSSINRSMLVRKIKKLRK